MLRRLVRVLDVFCQYAAGVFASGWRVRQARKPGGRMRAVKQRRLSLPRHVSARPHRPLTW
jgi:hypothetical protein